MAHDCQTNFEVLSRCWIKRELWAIKLILLKIRKRDYNKNGCPIIENEESDSSYLF